MSLRKAIHPPEESSQMTYPTKEDDLSNQEKEKNWREACHTGK
jgi:hypothetical protein